MAAVEEKSLAWWPSAFVTRERYTCWGAQGKEERGAHYVRIVYPTGGKKKDYGFEKWGQQKRTPS